MLAGCVTDTNQPPNSTPPSKPDFDTRQEPLQVGFRIKVELAGATEKLDPIEQDIHDDGTINMPYIGRITAAGKSPSQLEKEITAAYVPSYYTHLSVTVLPLLRFFYVGGQVTGTAGGRIQYSGPITILGAIQAAGDFTPFANKRKVQITRFGTKKIEFENCVDALKHPEKDLWVHPGDMIWVGRRGIY